MRKANYKGISVKIAMKCMDVEMFRKVYTTYGRLIKPCITSLISERCSRVAGDSSTMGDNRFDIRGPSYEESIAALDLHTLESRTRRDVIATFKFLGASLMWISSNSTGLKRSRPATGHKKISNITH